MASDRQKYQGRRSLIERGGEGGEGENEGEVETPWGGDLAIEVGIPVRRAGGEGRRLVGKGWRSPSTSALMLSNANSRSLQQQNIRIMHRAKALFLQTHRGITGSGRGELAGVNDHET